MSCRFHIKISFSETQGLQNFKTVHGDVVAWLSGRSRVWIESWPYTLYSDRITRGFP